MDKIIVTISGVLGILLTFWFFLMKKSGRVVVVGSADSAHSTNSGQAGSLQVDITVEGGYSPEVISIPRGKTTKLNFTRKDSNSCLEEVVLGDFGVRKYLPLNEKVTIEITPQKAGEFTYTCGMGMFHGKIIVVDPELNRRITDHE